MKLNNSLPLIIFAAFVFIFTYALYTPKEKPIEHLIGKKIKAHEVHSILSQNKVTLVQDKPTLVHVFSTWCQTCLMEHYTLNEINNKYGANILGLVWQDSESKIKLWLEKYGNPYSNVVMDSQSKVGIDLGITGVPETFIIGRNGNIIYTHKGPITEEIFVNDIQPKLTEIR